MPLSLFKTKEPAPTVGPHQAALNAHLAANRDIVKQTSTISVRLRTVIDDILRRDRMAADIETRRAAIDTRVAEARYSDQPAPDMSAEKRALKGLEDQFAAISEVARVAAVVKPRLQTDVDALANKRAELKLQTDKLLWDTAKEEANCHLAEYLAARTSMFAAAHKLFAPLLAADTIAKSRGFGEFLGSGLFHDLHVPIPPHASIPKPTAEAAQAARVADARLLTTEAEELIDQMLNQEA